MSAPESGTSSPAPAAPAARVAHPLHGLRLAAPHVTPAKEDDTAALALMRAGKPYLAGDAYLDKLRNHALALLQKGNLELDMGRRMAMWRSALLDLRPGPRGRCFIAAPFLCEYGFNVSIGDDVFIGPNATFLDVCPIRIGDRTMIGANAQFYTPQHPLLPEERDGLNGAEWAAPITIGDDVWVGGGVIVLGGVTIGDGSTVGAGAVVTRDVPPRSVVVGNPAKVVRTLPPPENKGGAGAAGSAGAGQDK